MSKLHDITAILISIIVVLNFREELHNQAANVCTADSSRTNSLHAIVAFYQQISVHE